MKRLALLLLAVPWGGAALAQTVVYSPRADSTSVTIYYGGIAQITETRRVDLPAGPVTLQLQGVVDSLLPQSAVITGLGRERVENNYDFDALTPQALIKRSVGQQVIVVRTNRALGTQTRELATIASAADGVVLRFDNGAESLHCSGLPERLEFSAVPAELGSTPTLSVKLAQGAAGPRTVTISYLAQRFTWRANYVAHLDADASHLDLLGWVTLINGTDTSFRQAQVQVVAGDIGLQYEFDGGSRPGRNFIPGQDAAGPGGLPVVVPLPDCYSPEPGSPALDLILRRQAAVETEDGENEELTEVQVTGTRILSREALGDYQLYRIDWPTDLNAHQAKQAAFLHARRVTAERFYSVQFPVVIAAGDPEYPDRPAMVALRWKNEKSAGLGEPLPGGRISVFESGPDGDVFAGDAAIDNQPVGALVEFNYSSALNLAVEHSLQALRGDQSGESARNGSERIAQRVSHRLINYKNVPVKVEVQAGVTRFGWSPPDIRRASQRTRRKDGDPLWVITVPANDERHLDYEIRTTPLQ